MRQVTSVRCYIEEYQNRDGCPSGRLREKNTGRKVDLGDATAANMQHFLQFLSAAAAYRQTLPDLFSRHGDDDAVLVSGVIDFDAPDEIRLVYNENLSYTVV